MFPHTPFPYFVFFSRSTTARLTHPGVWLYDDGLLVLLRHQHTGGEGRLDHVDHQVVGQDVQLLHLVASDVGAAGDAVTEQKENGIKSTVFCKPTVNSLQQDFSREIQGLWCV